MSRSGPPARDLRNGSAMMPSPNGWSPSQKLPRINAQTAAIEALAYNRTDEGVETLKEFLNDPHHNIWTPLAFAIQERLQLPARYDGPTSAPG